MHTTQYPMYVCIWMFHHSGNYNVLLSCSNYFPTNVSVMNTVVVGHGRVCSQFNLVKCAFRYAGLLDYWLIDLADWSGLNFRVCYGWSIELLIKFSWKKKNNTFIISCRGILIIIVSFTSVPTCLICWSLKTVVGMVVDYYVLTYVDLIHSIH